MLLSRRINENSSVVYINQVSQTVSLYFGKGGIILRIINGISSAKSDINYLSILLIVSVGLTLSISKENQIKTTQVFLLFLFFPRKKKYKKNNNVQSQINSD